MRRWIAVLAFIASLWMPSTVQAHAVDQAQNPVTIQALEIDLWPEYDRPGVLIIYRLTLASTVKLPAELTLRLPSAVGQPSAVAEQTDNGLFNIQFTNAGKDGNFELIRFTTTLPQLQIEYYDPGLKIDGSNRSFSYQWAGDYPVQDMQIKVQQPRTASGLKVEPKTGTAATESDGLVYLSVPVGKVNGGDTFQLNISYQKSDDTLTQPAAFEQVTPVGASAPGASAQLTLDQVLPWLLGGLGLILIGGGVFWYLRTGREQAPSAPHRHSRAGQAAGQKANKVLPNRDVLLNLQDQANPPAPSKEGVFCHQCGKKSGPADVFCRSCGTKLRK